MGDLQDMRQRAAAAGSLGDRYGRARDRYMATLQKSIDRRDQKRREAEEAARRAALEQQKIDAELRRDKQQQRAEMAQTAQRAMYAADAQTADYQYTSKLQKQQQVGVLKRDKLQAEYDKEQERQRDLALRARDARQFGYSMQENDQKFGQQLQRDYYQQGYDLQRAQQQHGNTLERDAAQFGYDTRREQQNARNTMQRDMLQGGIQAQRDQRLNEFDLAQQENQFQNTLQRDQMQQQFEQQNLYQREAADIAAKWQDQVAQARNAGLDFSVRQQKEMQDLDASFRKNVLNGPYDEGLKQRAMVEHQKKLAAIIPEEKVQNPQEGLNSSVMFHEPTGTWFMQSRDSRGFPVYEPLGSKSSGQGEDKQAAAKREALFDREDRFQKIVDKLATEIDPATEMPVYKSREEVIKAALDQFAPYEQHYRQEYGLPPMAPYQAEADKIRAKELRARDNANPKWQGPRQPEGQTRNPYREMLPNPTQQAPSPSEPVILSTKPLPAPIVDKLKAIPGGNQLRMIREKHSGKALTDQTVRMAADIVMNAMLTGDTSDPDYDQAIGILDAAGFTIGQ